MTDAEKYNFETRENDVGINFLCYNPIDLKLCDGDTISLQYEDKIIIVEQIKKISSDEYKGIIKKISTNKIPTNKTETYKEFKENDKITFNEKHIKECSKNY